jgi:hypothetical protein
MKSVFALLLSLWLIPLEVLPAYAQETPLGLWKTVDDSTGQEKGLVRIVAENGVLVGRIAGSLDINPARRRICDLCSDDQRINR